MVIQYQNSQDKHVSGAASSLQSAQEASGAKSSQGGQVGLSQSAQEAGGSKSSQVDQTVMAEPNKANQISSTTGEVQAKPIKDSKVDNANENQDKNETVSASTEQQIEDAAVPASGKTGSNKLFILIGAAFALLAVAVVGIIRWKRM